MGPALPRLRRSRALVLGTILGAAVALLILSSAGGASAHVASASATSQAPQSPGVPAVSGISCAIFGWDPCQSIGNAWSNFWNGVSNAANGIWNIVIGVFVFIYGAILGVIVGIFVAVTNAIASALISAINLFTLMAAAMGIFALPFMTISLVTLASALYLALDYFRDIPMVGAFT